MSQTLGKVPIMLIQFSTHSHHCINYRFCIHKIVSLLCSRIWQNLVYHLILASFYVEFFVNSGWIYFYWTSPIFKNWGPREATWKLVKLKLTETHLMYLCQLYWWFIHTLIFTAKKILCTNKSIFTQNIAKSIATCF